MALFEDYTPETIKKRILDQLETSMQTREGSFVNDVISPVSFEIWRALMTLEELVNAFYVDETSGKYLDKHAEMLGLARRQGTRAAAAIHFVGRTGVIIPAGTLFYTEDGLEFALTEAVTLADGAGTGHLLAGAVGSVYNVAPGTINQIYRTISGVDSYANDAASGGTDPESDAALYARIDARRKNPSTSGNPAYYMELALSCDGIGAAKVTPLWAGPGTCRVLLAGYDFRPLSEQVETACAQYLDSMRVVGAELTTVSVQAAPINVSAVVVVDITTTAAEVQSALVSKLDTYLHELAAAYFADPSIADYPVYYNKVASLLMGIPGVIDYSRLTINGGTGNVLVGGSSVPIPGEVVLTT